MRVVIVVPQVATLLTEGGDMFCLYAGHTAG